MALSTKAKKVMIAAFANKAVGEEVASAIEAGGNTQAAAVAPITSTDLSVPAPVAATLTDPVDAAGINAALDNKADNADVVALVSEVEARLDALEAKINAVITALKNAGLMAS